MKPMSPSASAKRDIEKSKLNPVKTMTAEERAAYEASLKAPERQVLLDRAKLRAEQAKRGLR